MPDKYGMLSVSLFEGLGTDIYEAVTHCQKDTRILSKSVSVINLLFHWLLWCVYFSLGASNPEN